MSRDQGAYLADMIEACDRVLAYTAALDAATLREDQRTLDAVVRNLEVLGEASKRVSADVRARATALPSREIAGLRDVLIHDYFGVDVDIVTDVTFRKIPALRSDLARLLAEVDGEG